MLLLCINNIFKQQWKFFHQDEALRYLLKFQFESLSLRMHKTHILSLISQKQNYGRGPFIGCAGIEITKLVGKEVKGKMVWRTRSIRGKLGRLIGRVWLSWQFKYNNSTGMNSQQIIEKIEEADKQIVLQSAKNNIREFFVDGKMNFSIKQQNNSILIFLQFTLLALAPIHTLACYGLTLDRPPNLLTLAITAFQTSSNLYKIALAFMLVLKSLIILSVLLQVKEKMEIAGVSWVSQLMFRWFRILKEVDLFVTAFLAATSLAENLAFFVVSCLLYAFHAVYLQNYVIRKQLAYATSFSDYLAFKSLLLLSYTANLAFVGLASSSAFDYFSGLMGGLLLVWFIRSGSNLFHHQFTRRAHLVVISLTLTVSLDIFLNLALGSETLAESSSLARLFLLFTLNTLILWAYMRKFEHHGADFSRSSVKKIDLSLSKLLECSFHDSDCDAELIGLLNFIDISSAFADAESSIDAGEWFYDPILRCKIDEKSRYLQKQSTLKYYIKNLYESRIQSVEAEQNGDRGVYLDYCEFLINYNFNFFHVSKYLAIAKSLPLTILHRIKVDRIHSLLRDANHKMNRQIYEGQLQIEHIIQAEEGFAIIETKIRKYIDGYLGIWELLKLQEVSLLEFRLLLKRQFRLAEEIALRWKAVADFFEVNRRWSFIYIHYQHFIRNERLKQKEADVFKSLKLENQKVFDHKPIYFFANAKSADLCDPLILFNEDTCYIQAQYILGNLIIKSVDRRFQAISGFTREEILNCSLEILLDEELKQTHQLKFDEWVESGLISNENSYTVKSTDIVTKELIRMPVYKYYKTFVGEAGLLFFCMMKVNLRLNNLDGQANSSQLIITNRALEGALITDVKVNKQFPSAALSEHVEKNIFIKEEMLQPRAHFWEIENFRRYSRVFLFLMTASIVVLLAIINTNGTRLTSYSNQFINYMGVYRFPVILATNYMKSFLAVGNQTKVNKQMQTATASFKASAELPLTKITIFDESLNPPNTYRPYYNYSFLAGEAHSQIDLFYMIGSTVSTLYSQPVNQTSPEFQRLNAFLKPPYDNMMNTTKFLLHQQFGAIFDSCISNQVVFTVLQSAIFVGFLGVLFGCVHRFIAKMRDTLHILLDFNEKQIHDIHAYWAYQREHFNILFLQFTYAQQRSARLLSSENIIRNLSNVRTGDQNTSLNKRAKQLKEDRERKCFELKLRLLIVLIMVAVLAIALTVEINMIVRLKSLKTFEEAGFFFLKYFPTGPLTTMGCTEKYYADRFPNEIPFNPAKYDDVLTTMFIFGNNNNYIGKVEDPSSTYYIKQKNYFFGNPCAFNPAILVSAGITQEKCESMAKGAFKQGLSSFLRYGQKLGHDCIYNQVNLTGAELDEFTVGGTLLSAYVLDAITTWVSEFSSRVVSLEGTNQVQCILVIVAILLIHFLMNELRIIHIVKEEYHFIKQVYLNMVPESILINQKVVKQKFIIAGLIRG